MKGLLKFTVKIVLILTFALMCFFGYRFCYMIFDTSPLAASEETAEEVTVRFDFSMSVKDVGRVLENSGLIENASVFTVQFKLFTVKGTSVIPGTYTLSSYMTPEEIIETITTETKEES